MKVWMCGLLLALCAPGHCAPVATSSPTAPSCPSGDCLRIVSDLQTMGMPAGVVYRSGDSDAVDTLYEHNPSSPTALGRRLHQALSRLSRRERAQLQFKVARNDFTQLGEALRLLGRTVTLEEGGAYDAVYQAHMDKAVEALRPAESDRALAAAEKDVPAVRETLLKHSARLQTAQWLHGALSGGKPSPDLAEGIAALDGLTGGKGHLTPRALLTIVRTLPEDSLNEAQWRALVSSFPMGDSINRMEILKLWRAGITGKGVKVGVVDSGADETHPYLRGVKVHQNFTNEAFPIDTKVKGAKPGARDDRGSHGTHVAGIIRALAPDAEIRAYKVLPGNGSVLGWSLSKNSPQLERAAADGLQCAADDGCTVLSVSLGWEDGHPILPTELTDKVKALKEKGVLIAVASSNDGIDTGSSPGYSEHALAVGSVTYSEHQSDFSSRNDVAVWGKGGAAIALKPDCLAYGSNVCSARFDSGSDYSDPRKAYVRWSGTSMATPTAAGAAALLQQRVRDLGKKLSPDEQRALLRETGVKPKTGPAGVTIVDPKAAIMKLEGDTR